MGARVSWLILLQLWCVLVHGYDNVGFDGWYQPVPHRPVDIITDVINDLGVRILQQYTAHGNVAFSPTGVGFVLAALYEGSAGRGRQQIGDALGLPRDRDISRIGFRDIHRRLRTYLNADGFLGGLTLNQENTKLRPEYEDVLRFYGFDLSIPEEEANETTTSAPQTPVTSGVTEARTDSDEARTETTVQTTMKSSEATTMSTSVEMLGMTLSTMNEQDRLTQSTPGGTTLMDATKTATTLPASMTLDSSTTLATETTTAATNMAPESTSEGPQMTTLVPERPATTTVAPTIQSQSTEGVSPPSTQSTLTATVTSSAATVPTIITTSPTTTSTPTVLSSTPASSTSPEESSDSTTTPSTIQTTQSTFVTQTIQSTSATQTAQSTESASTATMPASSGTIATESSVTIAGASVTEPFSESMTTTPTTPTSTSTTTVQITMSSTIPSSSTSPVNVTEASTGSTIAVQPDTSSTGPPDENTVSTGTSNNQSIPSEMGSTDLPVTSTVTGETGSPGQQLTTVPSSAVNRRKRSLLLRSPRGFFSSYPDEGIWMQDLGIWKPYSTTLNEASVRDSTEISFLVNGCDVSSVTASRYFAVLPFAYFPSLHAVALEFPLDDPRYNIILMMATDRRDTYKLARDLGGKSLRLLRKQLQSTWVRATIPSFMLRGFVTLTSFLQRLGISDVFEPRAADLTPMTPDLGVYARDVQQSIGVNIRNYMKPDRTHSRNGLFERAGPVPFTVVHPFLYFIVDAETSVTLIAGRVNDPLNSRIL